MNKAELIDKISKDSGITKTQANDALDAFTNSVVATLKKGDVYGELFQDGTVSKITTLTATERSVVFKINLMDFYFVMANHHELVQGLIKNVTEENRPQIV